MDKPIRGITTRLTWPLTLALEEFNTKPNVDGPFGFFFLTNKDGLLRLTNKEGSLNLLGKDA